MSERMVVSAVRVPRSDAQLYRITLGAVRITDWKKARAAGNRLLKEVFAAIKARDDIG